MGVCWRLRRQHTPIPTFIEMLHFLYHLPKYGLKSYKTPKALPMPTKQKTESISAQNIAERNRSEATFRAMFEASAVGIGILGLDRKIIDANPAMCRMFGRTREQFIGLTPAVATLPEDYPKSSEEFQELLDGKREYYWDERRYIRTNGDVFWAHVTMSVVRDGTGIPLYMVGMVIDISEQKQVMADLQTSESRFRAMFENAGVGIALVGLDRRPLAVNDSLVRISGCTREELLGTTGAIISHPDDVDIDKAELANLVAGEVNSYQVERRYLRKNDIPSWVRQTISAVRSPEGQLMYLVVMVEDIDRQKKGQESLQESEERFRAMFESSAIGVVILDVNTLIARANAAARDMLDDVDVDRKLKDVHEFIHEHYLPAEHNLFEQLLAGERDSYETERRYQRPGDPAKWAKVTFSAIRAANGQPRYLVAMLDEITEQKKAQEKLSQSEARFRAMFDNTSVGIALTTFDRRIIQVNEAAARITGYSSEELLTMNPFDLALPEYRELAQDTLQDLIDGKHDTMFVERRYRRKNGDIFWGRVTYSLVRDSKHQPQYLIGLIEDINDKKLADEKLAAREAEYLRMLEQRVEERTHELREINLRLVNEIEHRQKAEEALAAKAVEDAITAERTRLARDLHDAVTQTLFSASLIAEVLPDMWDMDETEARNSTEELRQLTRGALAEMRTLLLELRPAALTQARFPDLIKQLSEAVIGRARLPVTLDKSGEYEMPPEVKVTYYRIAQESLNNIVKYARASQVTIQLQMECCGVHMEIKDNGIGFDSSAVRPTSLGMHIMRERADAIHAHLKISSAPGQGTTVSLDWNENESSIPISKKFTRGEA
jgi:PAS domain S-box-containing protein